MKQSLKSLNFKGASLLKGNDIKISITIYAK